MGGSWTFLLVLAVAAAPAYCLVGEGPLTFSIETTWNGSAIDHEPIRLVLSEGSDDQHLQLSIEAPFFNDPPAPPGPPGQPFYGLWEYEVVEAFFLNDEDQYVEIEVCPWGQHIVLLLDGERNTIRHSLPMEVNTTRTGGTWEGTAQIPVEYLPLNVTKFNAYGIHGSGENRIYESLYPASENASNPDFHALEYFKEIDLSVIFTENETMSQFWQDSLLGLFRYNIETEWNGVPVSHTPVEITLQGFENGVEMNITAPFFDDPPPDGTAGQPFYGLWDYEVVEMFFLNDNDEYVEIELGPWGQHLLLLLKGARHVLQHSLELKDYIIVERTAPEGDTPGKWRGSALIPPGYFPPNVTRMNAFAIHGVNESRQYQSLYPAPTGDPDYPEPDFHRLELFRPIDFQFQVNNNSFYSDTWKDAIASDSTTSTEESSTTTDSGAAATTLVPETEPPEELELVTVLGPKPTSAPVWQIFTESAQKNVVQIHEEAASSRKPTPTQIFPDEPREQRLEDEIDLQPPTSALHNDRKPHPVRIPISDREGRPVESEPQFHESPGFQEERQGQIPFRNQAPPQFSVQGRPLATSQTQSQRRPVLPVQEEIDFPNQRFGGQNVRQPQRPSLFETQGQPQFQNQGRPQFQNQGRPQFQNQGRPQFQNQGRPQFQNQGQPQFQNQGRPQIQNQGQSQFQNQGQPQFQNQGQPQFQNEAPTQFQGESQHQFQTPNTVEFQDQGPPRFPEQNRPAIQSQEPPQFEDPSPPKEAPSFQIQNQSFQSFDLSGSQSSVANPPQNPERQESITPEVEEAVLTLAEETPALPPPHPVCFELGLVPDPDRCYVFHECVLEGGEWQMYSWRCRRGQRFDPINVACVRGRCSRGQTRRRRVRYP